MTDNEIIKALECCVQGYCRGCAFDDGANFNCKDNVMENALNLINRQKSEIVRLNEEKDEYPFKCIVGNNSEIHSKSIQDYDRLIADISTEAIKEFAERVKQEINFPLAVWSVFDNLVKGMVVEQELRIEE